MKGREYSTPVRISAALFYAGCSLGIIFVNKLVLTSYGFPSFSFLALSQSIFTVLSIGLAKALGYISFPGFSWQTFQQIQPLPLLFLFNALSGLGGTKTVNLAMFTVLRRFTIFITLIGERIVLDKVSKPMVNLSVFFQIFGAFLAASNDLVLDPYGYLLIMVNNFCSALNAVYSKFKLDTKTLTPFGLLFHNSLISLPILACLFVVLERQRSHLIVDYPHWNDPVFLVLFATASLMGCLLNLSIVLCTEVNSALTTIICGSLKNVITTYLGMFVGGDYVFSWLNFLGLNVSIFGSLLYSWAEFVSTTPTPTATSTATTLALVSPPPPPSPSSISSTTRLGNPELIPETKTQ